MDWHSCDPNLPEGKPLCGLAMEDCKIPQIRGASAWECINKVRSNPTWWDREVDIMTIGQAPGWEEDNIGIPFVGKSGQVLAEFYEAANIDLDRTFNTNLVKCRIPRVRSPNKPSSKEIMACKRHLEWEIKNFRPRVVILLGNEALHAFNLDGEGGIQKIHGKVFEKKFPGWEDGPTFKVIPTYHPAFFCHKDVPRLKSVVMKDFLLARNIIQRADLKSGVYTPEYKVCSSIVDVEELAHALLKSEEFAFDTESTSLPWFKNPLICFSFSLGIGKNWVLPIYLHDKDGTDLKLKRAWDDEQKVLDIIQVPFETDTIAKIAANGKYDYNVVRKWCGIKVQGKLWDPTCVPGNVEVLTHKGWIQFKDLPKGLPIMQWNKDSGETSFVIPEIKKYLFSGKMVVGKGKNHSCSYTPDHRIPYYWNNSSKLNVTTAEKVSSFVSWKMPISGFWVGGDVSFPQSRLLAAIQADGEIRKNNKVWFEFRKKQKIERLPKICSSLNVSIKKYSSKRGTTLFCVWGRDVDLCVELLTIEKQFGSWLLQWDNTSIEQWFEEIRYWDSHNNGKSFVYCSKFLNNVEWVATISHLFGNRAVVFPISDCWNVSVSSNVFAHCRKEHFSEKDFNGSVYCVNIPSSFFFIRSDRKILITGNCMHHLLNDQPPHDLEFLSDLEFQTGDYGSTVRKITGQGKKLKATYDNVPDMVLHPYTATDSENTFGLKQIYYERLTKKYNLFNIYNEETEPISHVLTEAEWNGSDIDIDIVKRLLVEHDAKHEKCFNKIVSIVQNSEFNPRSPKQVAVALRKLGYGEHITDKSKIMGYTTDNKTLEKLNTMGCELANHILEHRKIQKLKSTYLQKAINEVDSDGMLRYSYKIHGTETGGRLSCAFFHQIPRMDEERTQKGESNLRDFFVSGEGFDFIYADYEQVELRIMAIESGDKELLGVFERGEDVHKATAAGALGIPYDRVEDENRQLGKKINFAIIFGSKGQSISGIYFKDPIDGKRKKVTMDIVDVFLRAFKAKFSGVAKFIDEVPMLALSTNGVVTSAFGRERHIFGLNDSDNKIRGHAEREAVNNKIQSPAGSLTLRTIIAVAKMLKTKGIGSDKIRFGISVHDSVGYIVKKEYKDWFVGALKTIAERKIPQLKNYSFPVSIGEGTSWGEAELKSKVSG